MSMMDQRILWTKKHNAFQAVVAGMAKQGFGRTTVIDPAKGSAHCAYLNPAGFRCAVGIMLGTFALTLPDVDMYIPVAGLFQTYGEQLPIHELGLEFCTEMQIAHDDATDGIGNDAPGKMRASFLEIANKYSFTVPEVLQ